MATLAGNGQGKYRQRRQGRWAGHVADGPIRPPAEVKAVDRAGPRRQAQDHHRLRRRVLRPRLIGSTPQPEGRAGNSARRSPSDGRRIGAAASFPRTEEAVFRTRRIAEISIIGGHFFTPVRQTTRKRYRAGHRLRRGALRTDQRPCRTVGAACAHPPACADYPRWARRVADAVPILGVLMLQCRRVTGESLERPGSSLA